MVVVVVVVVVFVVVMEPRSFLSPRMTRHPVHHPEAKAGRGEEDGGGGRGRGGEGGRLLPEAGFEPGTSLVPLLNSHHSATQPPGFIAIVIVIYH